jgi:hypothetical protein
MRYLLANVEPQQAAGTKLIWIFSVSQQEDMNFIHFIDCIMLCIQYLIAYIMAVNTTSDKIISSMKTIGVDMYLTYLI